MVPDEFARSPYVSLATFRKDGTAVATPVWAVPDGAELLVWTRADSFKVKRVRANGRATVTVCDVRGRIAEGAPSAEGAARIMEPRELERVRRRMAGKYGWRFRVVDSGGALLRGGGRPHVGIAITLAPTGG